MDLEAANFILEGEVMDAGSKSINASYYKKIDTSRANITFTDLNPKSERIVKLDFEKPLNIKDGSFDVVIAMNILEHIYNHKLFVSEISRILKNKGKLVGCVPFLIPYHADPCDYFRYTHTALYKILEENGFTTINIKKLGEGGFLCCSDLIYTYYPNTIRIMKKLRFIHRITAIMLYLLNILLRRLKIGVFTQAGGAYLALSFNAQK